MNKFLCNLSSTVKQILLFIFDFCTLFLANWLITNHYQPQNDAKLWLSFIFALMTTCILVHIEIYKESLRLLTSDSYKGIILVLSYSCFVFVIVNHWTLATAPSLYFLLTLWLFSIATLVTARVIIAVWLNEHTTHHTISKIFNINTCNRKKNVALAADKVVNLSLIQSLKKNTSFNIIAYIDVDNQLGNRHITGLPSYTMDQIKLLKVNHTIEGILTLNMRTYDKTQTVIRKITSSGFKAWHYESSLVHSNLNNIENLNSLLERKTVAPVPELIEADTYNKTILVTGAGGSIGSELCCQVLRQKPNKIILLEHSEYNLYQIERKIKDYNETKKHKVKAIAILGSINDTQLLEKIMILYSVDTIYHAAAYKHVPIIEENIIAGAYNNIMGTLTIAQQAIKFGIKNFVLISSDKAVRPTNIMGASKRMAEMICQALAAEKTPQLLTNEKVNYLNQTRFSIVRFGNVLGSSGSVIPLFLKQISSGGPVTVTHPEITRYFMSIQEAAQLVLQAGAMGNIGEVFVLDMGDPIKINTLAKNLIEYCGYTSSVTKQDSHTIKIIYSGLRPGEKLYEELLIDSEVIQCKHPKIFKAKESMTHWNILKKELITLKQAIEKNNVLSVQNVLKNNVLGFSREIGAKNKLPERIAYDIEQTF